MSKYYEKRVINNNDISYEEAYWGTIKDPDGKIRNRLNEKQKFLDNVKSELEFINKLPSSKILDIGCGLGYMLAGISDKHQKFGLEVSKFATSEAEKYAKIFNEPFEDIDLKENSFDIIISHHVIEHIDSPENFLTKIKKILKPNGILIISTPDFKSVCANLFNDKYRMLHDKTHTSLFSFDSLKLMLNDFKFEITDFEFPYFNTEYFTDENILKLLNYNTNEISPACWGNFVTFYAKNKK
ncbi:class I SAM-dependent methyltransferase [bacterium]|nr:class I SAM-dependent methyltransferase [bacterium]